MPLLKAEHGEPTRSGFGGKVAFDQMTSLGELIVRWTALDRDIEVVDDYDTPEESAPTA